MAQLWLTYQEIADAFVGDRVLARDIAIERGWTRKHSSDGQTRVLMPPAVMARYFITEAERLTAMDRQAGSMAADLHSAFIDMSRNGVMPRATAPHRDRLRRTSLA